MAGQSAAYPGITHGRAAFSITELYGFYARGGGKTPANDTALGGATIGGTCGTCGRTELVHRYSFTEDARDSVGDRTRNLGGRATISGGEVHMNGSGQYIDLGGNDIGSMSAVTIDLWNVLVGQRNDSSGGSEPNIRLLRRRPCREQTFSVGAVARERAPANTA